MSGDLFDLLHYGGVLVVENLISAKILDEGKVTRRRGSDNLVAGEAKKLYGRQSNGR